MADINDAFEDVFLLEEKLQEVGYNEGLEEGKKIGWKDGWQLGLTKGTEVGRELGFYSGSVDCWLELNNEKNIHLKPRAIKVIQSLRQLLDQFPSTNIVTEDMVKNLMEIRSKFKQILSLLNITQDPLPSTVISF